jgi:hypothetical protein
MSVIVTIPNSVTQEQVAESRGKFVQVGGELYGAGRKYAADLIGFFRAAGFGDAWLTMEHNEKSAAGDAMRVQRDALYADLKARPEKHSNPSVKWKQIKDHAQSILAEQARAEAVANGEEPEGEGEGEGSGKAKHTRTLQLRLIEDLKGCYGACKREKARTDAQSKAMLHIGAALADLGIDLSTI